VELGSAGDKNGPSAIYASQSQQHYGKSGALYKNLHLRKNEDLGKLIAILVMKAQSLPL
jgi:hypothetical protein